jgi:hypothetical protein
MPAKEVKRLRGKIETFFFLRPRPATPDAANALLPRNGSPEGNGTPRFDTLTGAENQMLRRLLGKVGLTLPPEVGSNAYLAQEAREALRDYQEDQKVAMNKVKKRLNVAAAHERIEITSVMQACETQPPAGRTVVDSPAPEPQPDLGRPSVRVENDHQALKEKLRAWLLEHFRKPLAPDDEVLVPIVEAIRDQEGFEQFCEAAKGVNPKQGWKVFVSVARKCAEHRPDYARAKAAGVAAGESEAERFAREYVARHKNTS